MDLAGAEDMKYWLLTLFLAFSPFQGLQRIALRNQYAREASQAYLQKEYQRAAVLYERVRQAEGDALPTISVQVNLAHSYFHLRDFSRASPLYRALLKNQNPRLQSMVATQLSVIEAEEGNFTKALAYCKQAMTVDETNQAARYNYELLQKYLLLHPEKRNLPPPAPRKQEPQKGEGGSRQENTGGDSSTGNGSPTQGTGPGEGPDGPGGIGPENEQKGQNQDLAKGNTPGDTRGQSDSGAPQNQGGTGNQQSSQPGQEGDAQLQTRYERLKKLQLTPEKARQLLDAMRQEEAQFLQQLPRKSATKKDKNAPDW